VRYKDEAEGRGGYTGRASERAGETRGNTGAEGLIRGGYRHQSFLSRGFQPSPSRARVGNCRRRCRRYAIRVLARSVSPKAEECPPNGARTVLPGEPFATTKG